MKKTQTNRPKRKAESKPKSDFEALLEELESAIKKRDRTQCDRLYRQMGTLIDIKLNTRA